MEQRVKYPRTPHLPGSPGSTPDDIFADIDALLGGDVVMTEKMDGECSTLYRDGLHARSIDSKSHPSRDWLRALHGRVAHEIPGGMRVCGENLYARHSVGYDSLRSYFQVFNVWSGQTCLSWDDTADWASLLGLELVPVLYRGPMLPVPQLLSRWEAVTGQTSSEGFVVRDSGAFQRVDFAARTGKWVRSGHVQTSTHWMHQQVVPNGLRTSPARGACAAAVEDELPGRTGAVPKDRA